MKILKSDEKSLEQTVSLLKEKKVVILPTDTVYGFSGIVPETDSLIRKIKGREETKPFINLIGKPSDIFNYTQIDIPEWVLSYWPGPLTVIVPVENTTVAYRCPGDKWLRDIISLVGKPLYSTSVNYSGKPILSKIADIEKEFIDKVDLIVDDGDVESPVPSTIISLCNGKCTLIREGAVSIDKSRFHS